MMMSPDLPEEIKCIVFDFANTLYSGLYFNVPPRGCENWRELFNTYVFDKFDKNVIETKVMNGELGTEGIARIISGHVALDTESVVKLMEKGCKDLEFNPAILDFAIEQKNKGIATALVSVNMDIFTKTVVPSHDMEDIFDVIVNSFDYKETKKGILWDIAFSKLGNGITFSNSLLIDDGTDNVKLFKELGGYAYQYRDDKSFSEWLNSTGFNCKFE
jgi:FMN phosphatase YigB (HAD superfamily)